MTRGPRGALVARGGQVVLEVAPRKVEPVDTTAAGDTFAGVMVALLAEGALLEEALAAATVAASISVTRPGASTSMPTRAEIDAVLQG
jgi:ribokinase